MIGDVVDVAAGVLIVDQLSEVALVCYSRL